MSVLEGSAIFSLVPSNDRACKVVNDPSNSHLISQLTKDKLALSIGFHIRSQSCNTLAVLGRGNDVDIYVAGSGISRLQCSFEVDPDTDVIMLFDRSHGQTTQVFGEHAYSFEHRRRPRKILLQPSSEITTVGMGGMRQNLITFELHWHLLSTETKWWKDEMRRARSFVQPPRMAATIDAIDENRNSITALPSRRETRLHTPGPRQLSVRFLKIQKLGAGTFASVHKAINVDTGKFMAVKILRPGKVGMALTTLKREVEILSSISHPHIVDYLGWDHPEKEVVIFMGLKEGSLHSLVLNESIVSYERLAEMMLCQMLQALDYLTSIRIVHRDIKPENILYVRGLGEQCTFQLGDFGLSNQLALAETMVGTYNYAAPELFDSSLSKLQDKVDIWSLFVTVLWTLDIDGFRGHLESGKFKSPYEVQNAALERVNRVKPMEGMAQFDPDKRWSAAKMLVEYFEGQGLSTPRNQITTPAPAEAHNNGPALKSVKRPFRFNRTRQASPAVPRDDARVRKPPLRPRPARNTTK